MGNSGGVLQDTLDKNVENFWDVLENIMESDSKNTKAELDGAVRRFEDRLKESVSQSNMDSEEKEEKLFEIEIMISELEDKLETVFNDKLDDKKDNRVKELDESKSDELDSQRKIDEYPNKELKSLKKEFHNLDF